MRLNLNISTLKKIACSFALIVFCFVPSFAFASQPSQIIGSDTEVIPNTIFGQILGNGWDGQIKEITIESDQLQCPMVYMFESDNPITTTNFGNTLFTTFGGESSCYSNPSPTHNGLLWTWDIASLNKYFDPAKYYLLLIPNNYGEKNFAVYGSSADVFSGGGAIMQDGVGNYVNMTSLSDIYFNFTTGVAPSTIDFSYPSNNSTITDFSNWQLNINVPELTEFYKIKINYSSVQNGNYLNYEDIAYTYGGNIARAVPKNNLLNSGNWSATSKIYLNSTNELIAESPVVNFSITLSPGSGDPLPPTVTCEGGNWVSDNFCRVLRYLFVPSSERLNDFKTLFEPIGDKIPFSYFNELKTAISGVNSSATPAFTLNIPQNMQDTIFTPFRTAFTWVLWLIFGVWLFKRLNNFNL